MKPVLETFLHSQNFAAADLGGGGASESVSVARWVLAHRDGKKDEAPFPKIAIAQSYDAQDALNAILESERGWTRIGYKVGATSAAVRKALSLDEPFYGRLYKELTLASPAHLTLNPLLNCTIEIEIAVELAQDLKGENSPYTAETIKAATRAIAPAIEITGSLFKPGAPAGAAGVIADFAGHSNWIVGKKIRDFAALDLMHKPITAAIHDEVKETGEGANVDGGPFGSTAFLANALNKRGQFLKAGDVITTGTVVKAMPAAAGQRSLADYGLLGRVEVTLA